MFGGTIRLCFTLAFGLLIVACGHDDEGTSTPISPSATTQAEVVFHSDVLWQKTEGTQIALCTQSLPAGKVYLARNTITGTAVTTFLGEGEYVGHTCVYGTPATGPEGWVSDVQWTAADGDVLLAKGAFRRWTGVPGASVAIEDVTFQNGGTGRFQYAEGQSGCDVDAPGRKAAYNGMLRYGKK